MNGQPCIRDLRLTVRRVLKALALYPDREEFRREVPGVTMRTSVVAQALGMVTSAFAEARQLDSTRHWVSA